MNKIVNIVLVITSLGISSAAFALDAKTVKCDQTSLGSNINEMQKALVGLEAKTSPPEVDVIVSTNDNYFDDVKTANEFLGRLLKALRSVGCTPNVSVKTQNDSSTTVIYTKVSNDYSIGTPITTDDYKYFISGTAVCPKDHKVELVPSSTGFWSDRITGFVHIIIDGLYK